MLFILGYVHASGKMRHELLLYEALRGLLLKSKSLQARSRRSRLVHWKDGREAGLKSMLSSHDSTKTQGYYML